MAFAPSKARCAFVVSFIKLLDSIEATKLQKCFSINPIYILFELQPVVIKNKQTFYGFYLKRKFALLMASAK